jgi:hypothetical protein
MSPAAALILIRKIITSTAAAGMGEGRDQSRPERIIALAPGRVGAVIAKKGAGDNQKII